MVSISPQIVPILLNWFAQYATELPWRSDPTPYHVWLSEIMLQQTQIETVIPYYMRFLEKYPTIFELASAPLDDVLKMWEGLGYYSRARNLHKTAQIVAQQHAGLFPNTVQELQTLPGIGRYTAGAIASIAFGASAPILDGNVIRLFARLVDLETDVSENSVKEELWKLAEALVPDEQAGDYNQALMQLGQKICTPRNPTCSDCPIQEYCKAFQAGTQHERPVKKKKDPTPHYDVTAGIIWQDDKVLIAQRPEDGLLGGLWEFPGGKQEKNETLPECLHRELAEELAIRVDVGELFVKVKHAFTHFKITLHAFECQYIAPIEPYTEPQNLGVQQSLWVSLDDLKIYSFGKADRQVIQALQERKNMLL